MAKFAFLLPREEMLAPARRIAADYGMEVVMNVSVPTDRILESAAEARRKGADILVARGRQASILKEYTDLPVVAMRLTGQEVALLLHRAQLLVPGIKQPRVGVVTIPNMIGDIRYFDEILGLEVHTYFVSGNDEMEAAARKAIAEDMDVILGGDFVCEYCRQWGRTCLFWDGTEDSIRDALQSARNVGFAADAERKNTAHLQTLLAYSFNGIIELDNSGVVTQTNDMALKILGKDRTQLAGARLSTLMPESDAELLEEALRSGQEMYFSVLTVAGINVVANAAPMVAGEAAEGAIFSFYEMRKMERQGERALRERYRLYRYLAHGNFESVSHASREMQRLVKTARTFAETLQPILLQGEVGSGKTLFAQSIHNTSPCAKGPFVTFPCDAGQDDQGAALSAAVKEAHTGTLYLDAIDQLSLPGQYVLHRLLENGLVQRPGDERPAPISVRVIASTTVSLAGCLENGCFRPDLYYLLVPMLLELPPLRTRPEDLSQAIDMCLDDCVTLLSRYVVLTKEARRVLLDYEWPGNYNQLRAFVERMVLTAPSRTVGDGYVRQLLGQLYPFSRPEPEEEPDPVYQKPEAAALAEVLARNNGSRSAAAAELGVSKTTLWRRMKKLGIYQNYLH